jgi:hypothetical protein
MYFFDQDVQVRLNIGADVGLQQRTPAVLVAFAAVLRAFDLQQKADVDRILAGFSELQSVVKETREAALVR